MKLKVTQYDGKLRARPEQYLWDLCLLFPAVRMRICPGQAILKAGPGTVPPGRALRSSADCWRGSA